MTDASAVNDTGITADQESEKNALSNLVANILDAYPDKTPIYVKNQEGKYIGCSKGFLKLLGVTSDGVLGRSAREVFPEHIAKEDEMGDRALQWVIGQENMEVSIDIKGEKRFLLFKKNGFCSGRGSLSGGVIGVVTDITALKCRNVQNEMIDALASVSPGVYHDINNLLTPIGSTLTMIEGDIAKHKISFKVAEDKINSLKNLASLLQKHLNEKLTGKELTDLPDIKNYITSIENFFSQLQVSSVKYEKYLVVGSTALNQIKSILVQLSKLARVNLNIPVSEFNVNNIVVEATSMIFPGSKIDKELFLCENPWP